MKIEKIPTLKVDGISFVLHMHQNKESGKPARCAELIGGDFNKTPSNDSHTTETFSLKQQQRRSMNLIILKNTTRESMHKHIDRQHADNASE